MSAKPIANRNRLGLSLGPTMWQENKDKCESSSLGRSANLSSDRTRRWPPRRDLSPGSKFVMVPITVIFPVTTIVAGTTTMDDFEHRNLFWSYL